MAYRIGGHYNVIYGHDAIARLECHYCQYAVWRSEVGQPRSSKSGLGRYNRMLGRISRHLHGAHRERLQAGV